MKKLILLTAIALTATVGFSSPSPAADKTKEPAPAADNSKMNKEHSTEVTADQQKENASDRKITQKIRRAITKRKSLSTYAHNVKIITRDGAVTLKGPVRDEGEKAIVEKAAAQVVGKEKVTSELEIAPAKK